MIEEVIFDSCMDNEQRLFEREVRILISGVAIYFGSNVHINIIDEALSCSFEYYFIKDSW